MQDGNPMILLEIETIFLLLLIFYHKYFGIYHHTLFENALFTIVNEIYLLKSVQIANRFNNNR